MRKELDNKLVAKYPIIFKDRNKSMQQTAMCWGFPGNGWYELINNLCWDITKIMECHNINVTADQVKEKFGGLRFYITSQSDITKLESFEAYFWKYSWYWKYYKKFRKRFYKTPLERIKALVDEAERASYTICEICGKEGKTRGGSWIKTLCNECYKGG